MKKAVIIWLLLLGGFFGGVFAKVPSIAWANNEQAISAQDSNPNWWESYLQTCSYDYRFFYGSYQNTLYGNYASGFQFRPVWQSGRFEVQFDFAFYNNPWLGESWQWGEPMPQVKPTLPNFIDTFDYQGDRFKLNYQMISDLNFGQGLLINDYHPSHPYHGWIAVISPADAATLTFVATRENFYWLPLVNNNFASLQVLRWDQSLATGKLKWQLGLTDVHDNYPNLDSSQYPSGGVAYDLTLTNNSWVAPFVEVASFDHLGRANMVGIKGKQGFLGYQAGIFQAHGKFIPNYFGGRYEDLKWDSFAANGEQGLPLLNFADDSIRTGSINHLWVELSPWLNLEYFNLNDLESTTGCSLNGRIERLGLEYGLFYYNQLQDINYDWFLRGGNGYFGWEYHFYYDWDRSCHNDFIVSYKF